MQHVHRAALRCDPEWRAVVIPASVFVLDPAVSPRLRQEGSGRVGAVLQCSTDQRTRPIAPLDPIPRARFQENFQGDVTIARRSLKTCCLPKMVLVVEFSLLIQEQSK
jgi:hypothetical protein